MSSSSTVMVEKATSELLIGPDWTLNLEICDLVNTNQWQAKDVIKAVKKRLQHKNPRVHFYALILLETLIKNCGDYVHHQVAERDILQDMVKIVKKKTDMQVRDKILLLIDSWQEAFGGPQGKYPQYYWAYIELKRSGIQFPQRSPAAAPIFTPPITHPVPRPPVGYGMPSSSSVRLDEAMASESLSLSDLESIKGAVEVLGDMLQAINPNDRESVKDELIIDLLQQCRTHQKKLMHVVASTSDEKLLAQSLTLNDNLQYLIAKHDAIASGSPLPSNPSQSTRNSSVLPATVMVSANSLEAEEDEDDDFSQLARRKPGSKAGPLQSLSAKTGDQEVSPSSLTTTEETPSSSVITTLSLPDPPGSVDTDKKEQDLIDLLSITLSTNPSQPPTQPIDAPIKPPSASNGTVSQAPDSPIQGNPYIPQPYPANQGYAHNNYVVPWAQQTLPQPIPQSQYLQYPYSSSYPPAWTHQPYSATNNVTAPVNQYHATQPGPPNGYLPNYAVPPQQQQSPYVSRGSDSSASRMLQQQNSFSSRGGVSEQRPILHQQNSFGSRGGIPDQRPVNPTAPSNKPFIPSYRLFEDLVDLKTSEGRASSGSSVSGLSSQSMISGRK